MPSITLLSNVGSIRAGGIALLITVLAMMGHGRVHAQEWAQSTVVQTTVTDDGPVRRFLDTLTTRLQAHDRLTVRRTPTAPRVPLDSLQSELVDDGVGLVSANTVAVRSRFALDASRLVEEIEGIQFYCRLPRTGTQIPLMYVSREHPLIGRDPGRDGGPSRSFRDVTGADPLQVPRVLRLPHLVDHPDRQPSIYASTKREQSVSEGFLMNQLTELVYERGYSYDPKPD